MKDGHPDGQVRRNAAASGKAQLRKPGPKIPGREAPDENAQRPRQHPSQPSAQGEGPGSHGGAGRDLQRQAWRWALANRAGDGSLPSGREIACQHGRHERWGRLVKRSGAAGGFAPSREPGEPGLRLIGQRLPSAMTE
jgi:hypothetical protein